jgi:hypothetical protein
MGAFRGFINAACNGNMTSEFHGSSNLPDLRELWRADSISAIANVFLFIFRAHDPVKTKRMKNEGVSNSGTKGLEPGVLRRLNITTDNVSYVNYKRVGFLQERIDFSHSFEIMYWWDKE